MGKQAVILLFILIQAISAESHKIINVLGGNYFELDNGEKVSIRNVIVEDNNKTIRWNKYNLLSNIYNVTFYESKGDTTLVDMYDLSGYPPTNVVFYLLEDNNGIYCGTQQDPYYAYLSNYNYKDEKMEKPLLYRRPNILLLGVGITYGVGALGSIAIGISQKDNQTGYFIGGALSGLVSYLTIKFSLKKEYINLEGNKLNVNIPFNWKENTTTNK